MVTHDDTVPTLSAVVLSNNGDSNTRSNDGDTITVTFTGSEALLATPTCAMAFDDTAATNAETISYSGANNIWTCTVVAHDSDADGAVTFSLGFSDAAGNAYHRVVTTTGIRNVLPQLELIFGGRTFAEAQARAGLRGSSAAM